MMQLASRKYPELGRRALFEYPNIVRAERGKVGSSEPGVGGVAPSSTPDHTLCSGPDRDLLVHPGPHLSDSLTFQVCAGVVVLLMFLIGVEFSIPDPMRVQPVALVSDGGRKRVQHTDLRAVDFDIAKCLRRVQHVLRWPAGNFL
jgi:hypothetical protein